MSKKFFSLMASLLILLLAAPTGMAQESIGLNRLINTPESEPLTGRIKERALPLTSLEARHGFKDLKPLKRSWKDVRIIGLGEATHGTREFFQLKHRLVEFLVKELDFRVFAIEASYPAAEAINEYVLYGRGNRDQALASQGLWAWDTKEVTALIDWMRAYNQSASASKKVKFVGFDMHNNELALDYVSAYLKKASPAQLEAVEPVFKQLRPSELGRQHFEYAALSAAQKEQAVARLKELGEFLSLNESKLRQSSSAAEFARAAEHVRILTQFADIYRRPYSNPQRPTETSGYMRDHYMAENIKRIVSAEDAKTRVIVWAHNDHVGIYRVNMGSFLRAAYGAGYYAVGLTFNKGGFQAREMTRTVMVGALTGFELGPAKEGSLEWYFARTGLGNFLLDLRQTASDPVIGEWLAKPQRMRSVGLGFFRDGGDPVASINLKEAFDALVFIDSTTRATPNPTGERGAWTIPSH